jgi:uncharacterized protein (DUF1778 family)
MRQVVFRRQARREFDEAGDWHVKERAGLGLEFLAETEAKAMIERAAALMGTTVSSFMLQNAYEAARRIVSEDNTLFMTQRDFEAFTSSLENPPQPKPALRKLMARR